MNRVLKTNEDTNLCASIFLFFVKKIQFKTKVIFMYFVNFSETDEKLWVVHDIIDDKNLKHEEK